MKRFTIAILFALLLSGCIKGVNPNEEFHHRLIMNGRIEQGGSAVVMLSQSMPYKEKYSEEEFRDMVINWAKVTIIHGDKEEVLIGRKHEDYPTKYIYTGTEIEGIIGESYKIKVEYSHQVWEATTTINEPMEELYEIEVVAVDAQNYTIEATLPATKYPCNIECAMAESKYYAPTLFGSYAPSDTPRRITINRPMDNLIRSDYNPYFRRDEVVRIRINTLTDFAYDYWRKWEDNFINSINPVFPSTSNPPTNISNDGMGIWAGYGANYYRVVIE